MLDVLVQSFLDRNNQIAIIWNDKGYSYKFIHNCYSIFLSQLNDINISDGSVIAVDGDFSPKYIALIFSLAKKRCVIIPLFNKTDSEKEELLSTAQAELIINLDRDNEIILGRIGNVVNNDLLLELREKIKHPGLILFSSGTTKKCKAILHDFYNLINEPRLNSEHLNILSFLLFDHIGGINTLFYSLTNGQTLITIKDRGTHTILSAIEKHKVNILPTTPSFLNMVLVNKDLRKYDLSSLKTITYGTEVMPEFTLKRINKLFPNVSLKQTYGLSETGILRVKSENSASQFVTFESSNYSYKIVNGELEIKTPKSMLGYLNEKNVIDADGWFKTGDVVEQKNGYFRILGRKSDIINVGGEKVYPGEIESIILELDEILEVVVASKENSILGNIIVAYILPVNEKSKYYYQKMIYAHCVEKIAKYKIPQKIELMDNHNYTPRYKKSRVVDRGLGGSS